MFTLQQLEQLYSADSASRYLIEKLKQKLDPVTPILMDDYLKVIAEFSVSQQLQLLGNRLIKFFPVTAENMMMIKRFIDYKNCCEELIKVEKNPTELALHQCYVRCISEYPDLLAASISDQGCLLHLIMKFGEEVNGGNNLVAKILRIPFYQRINWNEINPSLQDFPSLLEGMIAEIVPSKNLTVREFFYGLKNLVERYRLAEEDVGKEEILTAMRCYISQQLMFLPQDTVGYEKINAIHEALKATPSRLPSGLNCLSLLTGFTKDFLSQDQAAQKHQLTQLKNALEVLDQVLKDPHQREVIKKVGEVQLAVSHVSVKNELVKQVGDIISDIMDKLDQNESLHPQLKKALFSRDIDGKTPLTLAIELERFDFFQSLIPMMKDIFRDDEARKIFIDDLCSLYERRFRENIKAFMGLCIRNAALRQTQVGLDLFLGELMDSLFSLAISHQDYDMSVFLAHYVALRCSCDRAKLWLILATVFAEVSCKDLEALLLDPEINTLFDIKDKPLDEWASSPGKKELFEHRKLLLLLLAGGNQVDLKRLNINVHREFIFRLLGNYRKMLIVEGMEPHTKEQIVKNITQVARILNYLLSMDSPDIKDQIVEEDKARMRQLLERMSNKTRKENRLLVALQRSPCTSLTDCGAIMFAGSAAEGESPVRCALK